MRSLLIISFTAILLAAATAGIAQEQGEQSSQSSEDVNYLDLAAVLIRDGNYSRGDAALDRVDQDADEFDAVQFYTLRGLAALRQGRHAAAINAFDKAMAAGEVKPVVHVYRAQSYFTQGECRPTIDALKAAGQTGLSTVPLYLLRAQAYWQCEEPTLALATLDAAEQAFPEDSAEVQRRRMFYLLERKLYQAALEEGLAYLSRESVEPDDYLALGNALRKSGQHDKAAQVAERARMQYPHNVDVLKLLALTYLDWGKANAAAQVFGEAARLDPALSGDAAEAYRRAGRLLQALEMNQAVSDSEEKLKQRLAILLGLKRFNSVAAMENDLYRAGLLESEDIRYALAYAYFQLNEFDEVEEHLAPVQRDDLFRKAIELRRAMEECRADPWRCAG